MIHRLTGEQLLKQPHLLNQIDPLQDGQSVIYQLYSGGYSVSVSDDVDRLQRRYYALDTNQLEFVLQRLFPEPGMLKYAFMIRGKSYPLTWVLEEFEQ